MALGKKDTTGPLWRRQLCLSRSPLSLSSLFLANCVSVYETKAERDRGGKQGRALFIPTPPPPPPHSPTKTQKRNIHRPPGNLRLLPRHRAEGESGEEKMKEVGRRREKVERTRWIWPVNKNTSVPQSAAVSRDSRWSSFCSSRCCGRLWPGRSRRSS